MLPALFDNGVLLSLALLRVAFICEGGSSLLVFVIEGVGSSISSLIVRMPENRQKDSHEYKKNHADVISFSV